VSTKEINSSSFYNGQKKKTDLVNVSKMTKKWKQLKDTLEPWNLERGACTDDTQSFLFLDPKTIYWTGVIWTTMNEGLLIDFFDGCLALSEG